MDSDEEKNVPGKKAPLRMSSIENSITDINAYNGFNAIKPQDLKTPESKKDIREKIKREKNLNLLKKSLNDNPPVIQIRSDKFQSPPQAVPPRKRSLQVVTLDKWVIKSPPIDSASCEKVTNFLEEETAESLMENQKGRVSTVLDEEIAPRKILKVSHKKRRLSYQTNDNNNVDDTSDKCKNETDQETESPSCADVNDSQIQKKRRKRKKLLVDVENDGNKTSHGNGSDHPIDVTKSHRKALSSCEAPVESLLLKETVEIIANDSFNSDPSGMNSKMNSLKKERKLSLCKNVELLLPDDTKMDIVPSDNSPNQDNLNIHNNGYSSATYDTPNSRDKVERKVDVSSTSDTFAEMAENIRSNNRGLETPNAHLYLSPSSESSESGYVSCVYASDSGNKPKANPNNDYLISSKEISQRGRGRPKKRVLKLKDYIGETFLNDVEIKSSIVTLSNQNSKPANENFPDLCLCRKEESVFKKINDGTKIQCEAMDKIGSDLLRCSIKLERDNEFVKIFRPSEKLPSVIMCQDHVYRLREHECCATCGLFCAKDSFVKCDLGHLYHRKCEAYVGFKATCPHCGHPSSKRSVAKMKFTPLPEKYLFEPFLAELESFVELPDAEIADDKGLPNAVTDSEGTINAVSKLKKKTNEKGLKLTYKTFWKCVHNGDIETLTNCLADGLNPNESKTCKNGSALHFACESGQIKVVHLLVKAGAILDILDREQNTPLMVAILKKRNDILKYLIKCGADLNFKNQGGLTALHIAAKCGNLLACQYLLHAHPNPLEYVNVVDEGGWTAITWAVESYVDVVRHLLSKGTNANIADCEKNIALHWAVYSGNVDSTVELLNRYSDMNAINLFGDTPLHIAARQEKYECVELLLARGARTDIKNESGKKAIECCPSQNTKIRDAIKLQSAFRNMPVRNGDCVQRIVLADITKGYEDNPIQVINSFDEANIAEDFVYITECCVTSNIPMDRTITSLKHCNCKDACGGESCMCSTLSERCWYDDYGRLLPEFKYKDGPTIFECNALCSCSKTICKNRTLQGGMTCRLSIVRTKSKGWGVITLNPIKKGTFVCEYVGEIITDIEADYRDNDSYLFDLEDTDGETYCVDALRYGNMSRFINHKCDPNIMPIKVFTSHQDVRFPRIAFFACRDIEANEELGFDYGEKFWFVKYTLFKCKCKSPQCRYSHKAMPETLRAFRQRVEKDEELQWQEIPSDLIAASEKMASNRVKSLEDAILKESSQEENFDSISVTGQAPSDEVKCEVEARNIRENKTDSLLTKDQISPIEKGETRVTSTLVKPDNDEEINCAGNFGALKLTDETLVEQCFNTVSGVEQQTSSTKKSDVPTLVIKKVIKRVRRNSVKKTNEDQTSISQNKEIMKALVDEKQD